MVSFISYLREEKNRKLTLNQYFKGSDMIVTQSDGSRKFHLAFDIRGFEPEEVKIKTQNRTLMISAKKEKKVSECSDFYIALSIVFLVILE